MCVFRGISFEERDLSGFTQFYLLWCAEVEVFVLIGVGQEEVGCYLLFREVDEVMVTGEVVGDELRLVEMQGFVGLLFLVNDVL